MVVDQAMRQYRYSIHNDTWVLVYCTLNRGSWDFDHIYLPYFCNSQFRLNVSKATCSAHTCPEGRLDVSIDK